MEVFVLECILSSDDYTSQWVFGVFKSEEVAEVMGKHLIKQYEENNIEGELKMSYKISGFEVK